MTGSAQLGAASLLLPHRGCKAVPGLSSYPCLPMRWVPQLGISSRDFQSSGQTLRCTVQAVVLQQTIPTALSRRWSYRTGREGLQRVQLTGKKKSMSTQLENKSPRHSGRRARITPSSLSRSWCSGDQLGWEERTPQCLPSKQHCCVLQQTQNCIIKAMYPSTQAEVAATLNCFHSNLKENIKQPVLHKNYSPLQWQCSQAKDFDKEVRRQHL